ncbi:MAG: bifunctional riboflavin kinase/FAD synthetase [Nitrospirales bacterium]|nr:bifunctional riboflavin kinase/FAD synthetase [Nitrospirales bacterium]
MEIIRDLPERLHLENPIVTLGNFDGVHLGHQKIFRTVLDKAEEMSGTPVAITFFPHPVRVLTPERGLKMISSFDDKARLISDMGIQALLSLPFTKEFARIDPEVFIRDILVEKLGTRWVIVGHNYAFGKGKKGTTALLRRRGRKYGFGVTVVRHARIHGDIVSSSRIRSLVHRGRVCETAVMLGRAYHIEGTVVKGAGRGSTILQIPTANIAPESELLPKEGVYAVRVTFSEGPGKDIIQSPDVDLSPLAPGPRPLDPVIYDGVANIGKNPTFGNEARSYEVHIFNLNRDLLGERLRVHFIDRIRDEKKFAGTEALRMGILDDMETAQEILARKTPPLLL